MAAERDYREAQEREGDEHDRGEVVQDLVGVARNDVLLRERLDAVGEGLEEAEPAGAVGAGAVLDTAEDFPLGEREVGEEQAEHREDGDDRDQSGSDPAQ